jgi:hypothetical protein
LRTHPIVGGIVRRTRFGWSGPFGGGWKLPWAVQLHALGDGTSRLVVKAPDAGRWGVMRHRVGLAEAASIARAFQGAIAPGSFAHVQPPMQRPMIDGAA